MTRKPRELSSGYIFHVFQRWNNKDYIFRSDESKGMFIHIVKEFNKKFDFELLAYVIMDNHYHMIIKVNNDELKDIMFNINNVFVRYVLKEFKRTGHIYESRYKCKRIEKESYLLWLLRYIHRNPIRAKIINEIDEYKWSSHYFYKNYINDTVNVDYILKIISNKKARAQISYMKLMNANGNDNNNEDDYKIIKENYCNKSVESEVFDLSKKVHKRATLEEISNLVFYDDANKNLMLSGCRDQKIRDMKISFIKEALTCKYTIKEIANYLNYSESAIRMILLRSK